jgi:CsoR family transcriptional regulator, copper-sensing transcriptional repressor
VYGYAGNTKELTRRLRRIEGQVRGIQRMVTDDQYCIDILTQISAAGAALKKVSVALLDDHIRHCVAEARGASRDAKVAEATAAVARLLKS